MPVLSGQRAKVLRGVAYDRVRDLVKRGAAAAGFDVHELGAFGRSMSDTLSTLKELGWAPQSIVDVGVAYGTVPLYEAFPDAKLFLIEPVDEWHGHLRRLISRREGCIIGVAAWDGCSNREIIVYSDPAAASLVGDLNRVGEGGNRRTVPAERLDVLLPRMGLARPFLMKIDVQGAELHALDGSSGIVDGCDVLLVEVSLLGNYATGALFDDVYRWCRGHGLCLFDIFGGSSAMGGRVLRQVDIAFVREDGVLARKLFG